MTNEALARKLSSIVESAENLGLGKPYWLEYISQAADVLSSPYGEPIVTLKGWIPRNSATFWEGCRLHLTEGRVLPDDRHVAILAFALPAENGGE